MESSGLIVDMSRLNRKLSKYSMANETILQDQLESFQAVVREVDKPYGSEAQGLVQAILAKANVTIEQLHRLIQVKLLRSTKGGTSRARRRAWATNKSKVSRLHVALKEHRENLLVALSANSSWVTLFENSENE